MSTSSQEFNASFRGDTIQLTIVTMQELGLYFWNFTWNLLFKKSWKLNFYVKSSNCYNLAFEKHFCGPDTVFVFVTLLLLCWWKRVWRGEMSLYFLQGLVPHRTKKGNSRIKSLEMEKKYGIARTSQRKDCVND